MPCRPRPVEPVDDGTRDGPGTPLRWHDDVHRSAWVFGEAEQSRRRTVTEHGGGPGAQQDRPQQGVPAGLATEGGVHAPLQTLPAPGPDHAVDDISRQTRSQGLATLDHAGLTCDEVAGELCPHGPTMTSRPTRGRVPVSALWKTA